MLKIKQIYIYIFPRKKEKQNAKSFFFFFQILATDKLSTLICANCIKNVNQWHTYKESCLRSQDKLQEWLASQSQSNPTVRVNIF